MGTSQSWSPLGNFQVMHFVSQPGERLLPRIHFWTEHDISPKCEALLNQVADSIAGVRAVVRTRDSVHGTTFAIVLPLGIDKEKAEERAELFIRQFHRKVVADYGHCEPGELHELLTDRTAMQEGMKAAMAINSENTLFVRGE